MKTFSALLIVLLVAGTLNVWGQKNSNALPWRMNTAYFNYLMRDVHQQYADREIELNKALQSKETILQYRDNLRERYKTILGDFPEKEELNAKVVASSQQNGFRVEKIIFESLPKRYVTANLYLPEGEGPFPASLELCGHGLRGKLGSAEAVLMALNGIAVLVVDPIGQGERIQLLDYDGKPATRGATTEHTLLNVGCNLLGSSVAAYELWDNHRAIDYLETRSDIDKTRLAAYGSSGGGTQTAYLIGLEERLKVACICSYFSQRERVLELSGASDGCQHVPGEGKAHIEISDWVTMFAPKPVLVMSGLYDFVDYWGAQQGSNELQKVYEAMGAGGAFKQFTAECGHGMPKVKREELATWFRFWLYKDSTPVLEKQVKRVPVEDMLCTPTGQVNTSFTDATSIPDYNLKMAQQLAEKRKTFLQEDEFKIKSQVLELLGIELPTEEIITQQTGVNKARTYDTYKYQIIRKGEFPVSCVVVIPEKVSPNGEVILCLNENGKQEVLNDETALLTAVNEGNILLVADLRGYGETADPLSFNESKYWNREYRNAMISLHIGKNLVGQRVIDVISLTDFISNDPLFSGLPIKLKANGTYGPVAVHATFLEKRIVQTEISGSLKSYLEIIQNPKQYESYSTVIPGVLQYYDLNDLMSLAGKNRIRFVD